VLFIMYTSGTTGLPKGAVHTHGTMIAASITINLTSDMRHGDRYLQMLPLFHVGALTPATSAVHRGATLVLMRAFDPKRVFPLIEAERITTGLAVPAMLNFMLAAGDPGAHDLSGLRWLMSGAAPVPPALIERYAALGIEIHQVYGLTETCGPACLISPEEALAKIGSTGPAFFHTDVRVVDERGEDVAPGEIGEVIVRGAHIMKGYWNRPEATAETIRDGWLHTGDLASVDKEGFVFIQDRKKDMIISGGENVYPAEIEGVLARHPDVLEVAVIGMPSPRWGESAAAVVVPKPDSSLGAADLIAFCDGKLARYKIPRVVELVTEIPRNPTGKVLKRLLRERFPGPAPE
jgi:acyl-CoA synthetase (AMP-forming)/AMP-acid ligase II